MITYDCAGKWHTDIDYCVTLSRTSNLHKELSLKFFKYVVSADTGNCLKFLHQQ